VIDAIREEVYRACLRAAAAKPGIFRLAAPTGAGKTISAGGFALHHAAAHGLRRVIVVVPFLTITEQNAQVYRDLLEPAGGRGVVLEHHSGVDLDQPSRQWAKLAAENWDAPFVVTTTVRLFESLFHRKPAAMRRLHRLAGAVIVLDEVQSLPHQMLVPILDALRTLVDHFGTTVLLASATQPDFWHLSPFRDLPSTEIVAEPAVLAGRLRRVSFEWRLDPSPDLAGLAADAAGHEQAMVVVNTTADARTVFTAWRDTLPGRAGYHLSTRMCAAHRRRVLTDVRRRLVAGEPVLLVSTQLIEAGVDVDFPVVYRVIAPADSLLQAAGRANREGNLRGLGTVIIVNPPDAHHPPAYRKLLAETRIHFGPGKADPDNQAALRAYYQTVYGSLNLEHRASIGQQIQNARRRLDFEAVRDGPADPQTGRRDRTRAFRMITDEGVTVVTPQGAADADERKAIEDLADQIRTAPRPEGRDLRLLQLYMTSVHTSALRRPGVAALMRPILGEPGQPGSLAEWAGGYDPDTGIDLDPRTEEFVC
jgi:CRISPR-associated endonuclease/helicase Cas3